MFASALRRGPVLLRRGAAVAACGLVAVEFDRRQPAESLSLFGSSKKDAQQPTSAAGRAGLYELGAILGEGAFGVVKLATERATGVKRAIKFVDMERSDRDTLENELKIMREAGHHRHIVSLIDEFSLPGEWALVLELVEGGEVFDRLCDVGLYSENDAASVVRQVALALRHLHSRGIVHRDLKPENLLLVSKKADSDVKLCDFGLAHFYGEGEPELRGRNGTVAYMAPEMHSGGPYDEAIDSWALGVILFILLGGYHPFDPCGASDDEQVARRVMRDQWSFDDDECWRHVSKDAKSLISRLLSPDPAKRTSIEQLLDDPWVKGHTASEKPLPETTTTQLKAFNDMRKTWRAAIRAASFVGRTPFTATAPRTASQRLHAPSLPPGAIDELKEAFHAYDTDGNGTIELGELQKVMRSLGAAEGQAELVMQAADVLHTGAITFDEFCAAVGPIYSHSEHALRRAFDVFDQDGNGTIERDELRVMMTKLKVVPADVKPQVIDQLFAIADTNHDGKISFEEFVNLFKANPRGMSERAP